MSRTCQITGKRLLNGNKVSHSNRKTKRKFYPNLHLKKFYLEKQGVWVTLKVSSAGLRTINKIGLEESLKRAVDKGFI